MASDLHELTWLDLGGGARDSEEQKQYGAVWEHLYNESYNVKTTSLRLISFLKLGVLIN